MLSNFQHIKRKYFSSILSPNVLKGQYFTFKLNPKLSRKKNVSNLKSNCTFLEICKIADDLEDHSQLNEYLYGNPLPRDYRSLGSLGKIGHIDCSESIISEINWVLISVRKFKKEISLFLEYKKTYEDAFLLGNYELAKIYLNKIEGEICHSLWTLENRFLITEISDSPEAHKAFLSEFNKTNEGYFVPTLAYYLSNRSERNFSVLKYNSDIQSYFGRLTGSYAEANRQFYYFHLNYFEKKDYTKCSEILCFDSYHSIIDRYISLRKVLKLLVSNSESPLNIMPFYVSRINYLIKRFNDDYLKPVIVVNNPAELQVLEDPTFNLKALDFYTSGLYKEAEEELALQIEKHPRKFEYYYLYIKVLTYLNSSLKLPNTKKSFQNIILTELFNQISKCVNPQATANNISRIIKNLSSFEITDGLFSFYDDEFGKTAFWKRYKILSLSLNNPKLAAYYEDLKLSVDFIEALINKYSHSITLSYFLELFNENEEKSIEHLKIPQNIKAIELAKFYQNKFLFNKASKIWKEIIEENSTIAPILETAVRHLFKCYLHLDTLDFAISLFVDSYLSNENIIQKIDCSPIHDKIRKEKFRNVTPSIDLPLFYLIQAIISLSSAIELPLVNKLFHFNPFIFDKKRSALAAE